MVDLAGSAQVGSEGRRARTGKDLWGQKSERLGSIDTLRASGAGDS
jgi:hypothetical protein